jgi:hypothetical protein
VIAEGEEQSDALPRSRKGLACAPHLREIIMTLTSRHNTNALANGTQPLPPSPPPPEMKEGTRQDFRLEPRRDKSIPARDADREIRARYGQVDSRITPIETNRRVPLAPPDSDAAPLFRVSRGILPLPPPSPPPRPFRRSEAAFPCEM